MEMGGEILNNLQTGPPTIRCRRAWMGLLNKRFIVGGIGVIYINDVFWWAVFLIDQKLYADTRNRYIEQFSCRRI